MDRLHPGHPDYPDLLGAISSPPTLDVRGALTEDDALALAIVGARAATPYGIEVTERLAGELAARGVTIAGYEATGPGTATIRATATPLCSPGQACPAFAMLFEVRVTVV